MLSDAANRGWIPVIPTLTAQVDAELSLSPLEETITVTGATPLVAVQSATQQRTVTKDVLDTVRRSIQRATALTASDLKKGVTALATIGSTAPFVGLFGTVVGIIGAFVGLAQNESAGIGAVGGAIAEALVTTAAGIAVAVPAVWLFNYFTNKVSSFGIEMENSASELIDYFIKQKSKQLKG